MPETTGGKTESTVRPHRRTTARPSRIILASLRFSCPGNRKASPGHTEDHCPALTITTGMKSTFSKWHIRTARRVPQPTLSGMVEGPGRSAHGGRRARLRSSHSTLRSPTSSEDTTT